MAPRSLYIDAKLAATACTIRDWHPTTGCENSEEKENRRLRTLNSDLFRPRECDVPTSQKETSVVLSISLFDILSWQTLLTSSSMEHNRSTSAFLRLPPEIRVRIYKFVLGGQRLWISHTGSKVELRKTGKTHLLDPQLGPSSQYFHRGGSFGHSTADPLSSVDLFRNALHLGLLRVCRQIYAETALLPYALNKFTFRDDLVRRMFEQSARPGKKRVQKKAVGAYEIGSYPKFRDEKHARATLRI